MKIALVFLVSFLLVSPSGLLSQERTVFLEIGGSGGLGSINYELVLHSFPARSSSAAHGFENDNPNKSAWITLRTAFSTSPIDKNNGWVLTFPAMLNCVVGVSPHKFEIGAGFAPSITTRGALFVKSPLMMGYRYWPKEKKIFFRVTYTPIFAWLVDFQWQHWAGISIGYRLNPKQ